MAVSVDISTQTIRKLRNRIIPLLFVLFIVAYVDRINIGFAALTMNAELAITSEQFGLLTGIFLVVISYLKSPATCFCIKSVRVFGLLAFW
jgi:ACS family tartrate transporter-like MFS transporter